MGWWKVLGRIQSHNAAFCVAFKVTQTDMGRAISLLFVCACVFCINFPLIVLLKLEIWERAPPGILPTTSFSTSGLLCDAALVVMDRTWFTSFLFSAFQFQVAIGLEAALTKYTLLNNVWGKKRTFHWNYTRNWRCKAILIYVSSLCVSNVLTAFPLWQWSKVSLTSIFFFIYFLKNVFKQCDRDLFLDPCAVSGSSICISLGLFLMIAKMSHQATN